MGRRLQPPAGLRGRPREVALRPPSPPSLLASLLLLSLTGCGEGEVAAIDLSWVFADGRSCADSGTTTLRLRDLGQESSSAEATHPCQAGLEPAFVSLVGLRATGVTIELEALTPQGTTLYRGRATLAPLPVAATIPLYAR